MPWTTPRTWVPDELHTAAMLNAHVRDNINYLFDVPAMRLHQHLQYTVPNNTATALHWDDPAELDDPTTFIQGITLVDPILTDRVQIERAGVYSFDITAATADTNGHNLVLRLRDVTNNNLIGMGAVDSHFASGDQVIGTASFDALLDEGTVLEVLATPQNMDTNTVMVMGHSFAPLWAAYWVRDP